MKYYDTERLKNDADCREVAKFLGMQMQGVFCECVSGLHEETQINHCIIHPDHVYCFSCGDHRDVIGMVMGYYQNKLSLPINYGAACKFVGDVCGGHELYLIDKDPEEVKRVPVPYTEEELEKVGIKKDDYYALKRLHMEDPDAFRRQVRENAAMQLEKIDAVMAVLGNTTFDANLRTQLFERRALARQLYRENSD